MRRMIVMSNLSIGDCSRMFYEAPISGSVVCDVCACGTVSHCYGVSVCAIQPLLQSILEKPLSD